MAIDVEQEIVYKIQNTAAITTIASTRISPLRLPDQAVLPAITYQLIDAPISASLDEQASGALAHARYQIDAWAFAYSDAVALGKAIFNALHGFKGVITNGVDSFAIMGITREAKSSNNDATTALYWISQDFLVWYGE